MSEEALLQLAQGELSSEQNRARDELIKKYTPMVRCLARRYFLAGAEQEDLMQEGMIGLFRAVCSFQQRGGASFATYAWGCVKNEILKAVRTANSENNLLLSWAEPLEKAKPLETEEEDPEAVERNSILWQRIKDVATPLELRVVAAYLEGFSYREIETKLNLKPKVAGNAIYRVRKKLQ